MSNFFFIGEYFGDLLKGQGSLKIAVKFHSAKSMAGVRDISRENSQWMELHRQKIGKYIKKKRKLIKFSTLKGLCYSIHREYTERIQRVFN